MQQAPFEARRLAMLWAIGLGLIAPAAQAAPEAPQSLAKVARPEPSNLSEFVVNKTAAIALGKALFWDMQLGSDGKTACASCHFQAGADSRSKNSVAPGLARVGSPDTTFQVGGPNYQFKASDFPFHQLADVNNRDSQVLRSVNDIAGSQGVTKEKFNNVVPGQREDARQPVYDPVFHVGANDTRQVTGRQAPSVINAVFNLRNFWDGRAQTIFNGVNPFGKRDTNAKVYKNVPTLTLFGIVNKVTPTSITLNDSSLASQASGPPLSDVEMSATGRPFADLGRKMLSLRPLAGQQVAGDDSVLAGYRHASGDGLGAASYTDLVKAAFQPAWWNGAQSVTINNKTYTQAEANFSLFFGLAVQLYEATLVSDRTPFDLYAEGNAAALSDQQKQGLAVFWGKGSCANCHGGPEFTNASIRRRLITDRMSNMIMGDGNYAVYDEGFYNIGITPTNEDLGVGGNDPFGNPLSFSGLAKKSNLLFQAYEGQLPNVLVTGLSRIAVQGAFKTPGLRNVELTAPYFHHGGVGTLTQVVDFYNRGGNFARNNIANLDADIKPLGLTDAEKSALVAFLRGLTDPRVRSHAAPFDHPQLAVPNGHVGDTTAVSADAWGRAVDQWLQVPAVGRGGYAPTSLPQPFLGIAQ